MGSILGIKCKCGFKTKLTVGGGKMNFQTFCGAPAYCTHCKSWSPANYLEESAKCHKCGKSVTFYDDKSLQKPGQKPKGEVFGWNMSSAGKELKLPDAKYFCPQCEKFTLKFAHVGYFD